MTSFFFSILDDGSVQSLGASERGGKEDQGNVCRLERSDQKYRGKHRYQFTNLRVSKGTVYKLTRL